MAGHSHPQGPAKLGSDESAAAGSEERSTVLLQKAEAIKSSKKSCVKTFPSCVSDGLVFVWLDTSSEV